MKTLLQLLFGLMLMIPISAQISVEDAFSQEKMKKDLALFRSIRAAANSGVYKYRSQSEIDSIYQWAFQEIEQSESILDFYHILLRITDFEGSLHNDTALPKKYRKSLREEKNGYFPLPLKWIDGKMVVNYQGGALPLGSEIKSINGHAMEDILPNFYKYYTTDGFNLTGKRIGINARFSLYYRLHYGRNESFTVTYMPFQSQVLKSETIQSTDYISYAKKFKTRHSRLHDHNEYTSLEKAADIYQFKLLNASSALLTVNSFSIGGPSSTRHLRYVNFLDSCFQYLQTQPEIKNLVIDVMEAGQTLMTKLPILILRQNHL